MAKKEERKYITLESWEVENVRKLDFGTFFTLKADGCIFYDLRVVPAGKSKDGKKYNAFIACPERKGSDGKYYKVFNLYIAPKDESEIVAEVEKAASK